jgi:archaellum component FlaG (FlaF/FlaG flagellin family)
MIVLIIIAAAGSSLFYFLQPSVSEHSSSSVHERQEAFEIISDPDLPSYTRIQL